MDEAPVGNYFVSAYPPFSCWSVAGLEPYRRMLENAGSVARSDSLGLYVHVPFCAQRCDYCYYLSYAGRGSEMERYASALSRELRLYWNTPAFEAVRPSFVYFGGGTPSLLPDPLLARLLDEVRNVAPWSDVREATFECAPRSVTADKLTLLLNAGITRISLGVQHLDDDVLENNGRVHRVSDVRRAYDTIRGIGFDVVNLDLIVGLIGETEDSLTRTLDGVIEMQPDSVTIYQLEIPHNTPLYGAMRAGTIGSDPAPWPLKRARLSRAFARLMDEGYSVRSAYSAVRDPERGRFVYQEEQYRGASLLGIGASSFSYIDRIHQQNVTSLTRYVDLVESGRLPLSRAYALNDEECLVREFVLQLKLGRVEIAPLLETFGPEAIDRFREPLSSFERDGLVVVDADAVRLTDEGLPRVDRMLPELYLPRHRVSRYS